MNQTATQKAPKAPKPAPVLYEVEIDLPAHCTHKEVPQGAITVDGKIYVNGEKYMVSQGVAATLSEIMANAWKHDAQIHGTTNENSYRRPKQPRVRGF